MATRLSRGATRLREALAPPPERMTQVRLAELCEVTPQAVWNWVNGHGRPGAESMALIEKHLGIPMRDWVVDEPTKRSKKTGTEG